MVKNVREQESGLVQGETSPVSDGHSLNVQFCIFRVVDLP